MLATATTGGRKPRSSPLPQSSKRLSPEIAAQIQATWTATRNTAEVGRRLGIHEQTVHKHLNEAGVNTAARVRTERDNARIVELYMEGRSIRDVAAKSGWSKETVWNTLREWRAREEEEE